MSRRVALSPAPSGPAGWLACPYRTPCYVIWEFARNKTGAEHFLMDLIDNFGAAFQASGFCNFPSFPKTVPDLLAQLSSDPQAQPHSKYNVLRDALFWTRNLGHPGYAMPAVVEVFEASVLPRMFAAVPKGELNPSDAVAAAEREIKAIYEKWRA